MGPGFDPPAVHQSPPKGAFLFCESGEKALVRKRQKKSLRLAKRFLVIPLILVGFSYSIVTVNVAGAVSPPSQQ